MGSEEFFHFNPEWNQAWELQRIKIMARTKISAWGRSLDMLRESYCCCSFRKAAVFTSYVQSGKKSSTECTHIRGDKASRRERASFQSGQRLHYSAVWYRASKFVSAVHRRQTSAKRTGLILNKFLMQDLLHVFQNMNKAIGLMSSGLWQSMLQVWRTESSNILSNLDNIEHLILPTRRSIH